MLQEILVENLCKNFGQQEAVKDFSFTLEPGEVMAFLGTNGSGKTTTIRCLLGIYLPDSGKALVKGKKYSSNLNSMVGYLPEERGIYTKARVRELFEYFAELRNINKTTAKKSIDTYLERVELSEHQSKYISQLSSGMQQKVQIGITIMHSPQILILDEPFRGLDPVNRQIFLQIFTEMNKELGTSILYSTHVVDEAQKIADKVVMIQSGKRIAYGTIDEVRSAHGTENILITYSGKLPQNSNLYTANEEGNTAELVPVKNVSHSEILKYLITNNITIKEFKIDRPSLNQIFIELNKNA